PPHGGDPRDDAGRRRSPRRPDGHRQPGDRPDQPDAAGDAPADTDHARHGQHRQRRDLEPGALDDGPRPARDVVRLRPAGPGPRPAGAGVMRRTLTADRMATIGLWALAIFVITILLAIILHFLFAAAGTLSPSFLFGDP